jgi:hypothetical protein
VEKYRPLEQYLERQAAKSVVAASLDFGAIENILQDKLPMAAFKWRAWWGNDRHHVHAVAWLDAGWKVESVDLSRRSVTFISTQ